MKLSLKKYLTASLKWFAPFVFIGLVCLFLWLADTIDTGMFLFIAVVIDGIFLLPPAGYYFVMFLVFRKKCTNFTPVEGIVANWKTGFYRYTGSIIVNVDGKEYSTSAYFSNEECKELVGKTISYAIIGETLFIYEIKD